jgi:hypothetical protein
MRLAFLPLSLVFLLVPVSAAPDPLDYLNHNRPVPDAHNCYPSDGKWADRIDRALKTRFPVAIEQDLAWYADPNTGEGRIVVSHSAKTTGAEPTLQKYFFERVRPVVEKALAENHRDQWPLIVLHFDFKDNSAPLLHAVWKLLGEYEGWITTAIKTADPHELSPFEPQPLLVLTEDSDAQEAVFYGEVPVGAKLRLFGSAHTRPIEARGRERNHLLATLPPDQLLAERPTTYRRWWNNAWNEVEEGGQREAGDWTEADDRRLHALVDHAHRLGFWIRFYTLDGFTPAEDRGWGAGYNFGTRAAAEARWRAAIRAGVNLIATDQYEDLAAMMGQAR